jgi:hypothetical protein
LASPSSSINSGSISDTVNEDLSKSTIRLTRTGLIFALHPNVYLEAAALLDLSQDLGCTSVKRLCTLDLSHPLRKSTQR